MKASKFTLTISAMLLSSVLISSSAIAGTTAKTTTTTKAGGGATEIEMKTLKVKEAERELPAYSVSPNRKGNPVNMPVDSLLIADDYNKLKPEEKGFYINADEYAKKNKDKRSNIRNDVAEKVVNSKH